jgi:hypothetical protein
LGVAAVADELLLHREREREREREEGAEKSEPYNRCRRSLSTNGSTAPP